MLPGSVGIGEALLEVEAASLIEHLEDEAILRDVHLHLHARVGALAVPAQDRVRERLAERDGDVQAALALRIRELRRIAA